MKKIIIIEPVLKHWTTVEPLLYLYLKNDFFVYLYAHKSMVDILNNYHFPNSERLVIIKGISIKNTIFLFFSRFDIVICASKFFYNKRRPSSFTRVLLDFLSVCTKILFLKIGVTKKSRLMLTSTFIEGFSDSFVEKFYPHSKVNYVNNFLWNYLWKISLDRSDGFNVYSSLVRKKVLIYSKKPVLVAPNALFRYEKKNVEIFKKKIHLKIVIPGRVDARKRIYSWLNIFPENLIKDISILLLGRIVSHSDKYIVNMFENVGMQQKFALREDFISFQEFDNEILDCDFLLCPFIEYEDYDQSINQVSGALFDSVRYGKPILVPSYSPVSEELRGNTTFYDNHEHLILLISRLLVDFDYRNLLISKANHNSKNFTATNLEYRNELESFC